MQRVAGMPELRFRAQKEIDGVVGRERLPTSEDERRLPLVRAIVKVECMFILTEDKTDGVL